MNTLSVSAARFHPQRMGPSLIRCISFPIPSPAQHFEPAFFDGAHHLHRSLLVARLASCLPWRSDAVLALHRAAERAAGKENGEKLIISRDEIRPLRSNFTEPRLKTSLPHMCCYAVHAICIGRTLVEFFQFQLFGLILTAPISPSWSAIRLLIGCALFSHQLSLWVMPN
jgi:hypothetical protein